MIPRKYYKITFTVLMGMSMGFAITIINSLLAVLGNPEQIMSIVQVFPLMWLRAIIIATPVAYFIVPPLQKMTEKLVKSE